MPQVLKGLEYSSEHSKDLCLPWADIPLERQTVKEVNKICKLLGADRFTEGNKEKEDRRCWKYGFQF